MEAFLANLKVVLPVVGLDLLKPRPQGAVKIGVASPDAAETTQGADTLFEIRHRSGVKAFAVEGDGEFIALAGSQALKDTEYARNSYARLEDELIADGTLAEATDGSQHEPTGAFAFKSPFGRRFRDPRSEHVPANPLVR